MSRQKELVWIFDTTFVAWGCKGCEWQSPVEPRLGFWKTPSDGVRAAFDRHECVGYPRKWRMDPESLQRRA